MDQFDVVIVGGGIVGCAAAYALAPDHDVLVIEKNSIASGATGKASGLLSPVYDHQENLAAAEYAMDFLAEFDGTRHVDVRFTDGVFLFAEEERDHAEAAASTAGEAGYGATVLDPPGLEERYPGVFDVDQWAGAVIFEDVGWVDSHTFTTALAKEAEDRGATIRTGDEVLRVLGDEAVTGVRTARGDVGATTVVVAAGWRSRTLLEGIVEIPVRPFRYQTVDLAVEPPLQDSFPMAWEHETLLYWRPTRQGTLHVGGRPYFVGDPGTTRQGATADFKRTVAGAIPDYLPSLGDPRLQSDDTCVTGDAATPDALPILDAPGEGPTGLVVATGMHGFGIMLAPVAGAAVRSLVTHETAPFPLSPYRLDRFDDRGTAFDSTYIDPPP